MDIGKVKVKGTQLWPTVCDPMNYYAVHGILQNTGVGSAEEDNYFFCHSLVTPNHITNSTLRNAHQRA